MSISVLISTYQHMCNQIKRSNDELRELRARKKALEAEIKTCLEHVDGPGIIVEGIEVSVETKPHRERLGRRQRREEIVRILADHGLSEPDQVFQEISTVGNVSEKSIVKLRHK